MSRKEEGTLILLKVIVTKKCFTKFSPKISEKLLHTTLKFFVNFFHCEFYHKNQVDGSNHAQSYIFHKSATILTFNICIWNMNLILFLRL